MGLIDECERYFHVKSLYDVLSVDKNATVEELKKAYKRLSLLIHPDKVAENNRKECTRKFQIMAKVHCILSNTEKRQLYDETGIADDENDASMDDSSPEFWENYWRTLFPKVNFSEIEDFFSGYKGSEEEKEDLKKAYLNAEGDMDIISEIFIGYSAEEEDRFVTMLKEMIKKKDIPSYPKFKNETPAKKAARKKRETQERSEAKEMMNSLGTGTQVRSIQRETGFNNMIARLEAKYGKKDEGRKKKKN